MLNKPQKRYQASPRRRARTFSEHRTQPCVDSQKVFIIHHLAEPTVDPLRISKFKKVKEGCSQLASIELRPSASLQTEVRDPWKWNYTHHVSTFRRNKTEQERNSPPKEAFRTITDIQIAKLKTIMSKVKREKQSRQSFQKQSSPRMQNRVIRASINSSGHKNQLKDVRVAKLELLRDSLRKDRFRDRPLCFTKLMTRMYAGKQLARKRKKSSQYATLTGWITRNDFQ